MENINDDKAVIELMSKCMNERSYFVKYIDLYLTLSYSHKKGFLDYIVGELSKSDWIIWKDDDTMWVEIVKGLLMEYSGRKMFEEPYPEELSGLTKSYINSKYFVEAERLTLSPDESDYGDFKTA